MTRARIQVVEDSNIVASDIKTNLTRQGYEVVEPVPTGEGAVALAGEAGPDLVLMDIILKDKMDGVKASEQIRTRFDIPIVFVTAHADDATLARAKAT